MTNWLDNTEVTPMRIKFACRSTFSGGTPSTDNPSYWDGNIPWIASGELQNCVVSSATSFITQKGLNNSAARIIPRGSVAVAMTGATCANAGYIDFDTSANQSVYAYVPKNTYNAKYLYYALIAMRQDILSKQNGGAQAGINGVACKNLLIPLFTMEKQNAIAAFLDEKIGAIDSLIKNLEMQIDEYKKYKASLISEYIATGMSSPEKIKYHSKIVDTKSEKDGLPYFALENIESGTGKFVQTESQYSSVGAIVCKKGDICFGKLRPYLKKYYAVRESGTCSSEFIVFRENANSQFIYYLVQSEQFIQVCNAFSEGTKMPRINAEVLKNCKFYFPDKQAQMDFVSRMKKIDDIMERRISLKQMKIEELIKYKTSLIYECVTGKKEVQ